MQKFVLKLASLGLVAAVLFFSACGEDPISNPLGPTAALVSGADVLTGDADLELGESFKVALQLTAGDAPLKSVEIDLDGAKLATDRFSIDGGAIASNNPFLITGADKDGATYTITINPAADQMVGDVNLYTFTVTDENEETAFADIQITIVGPATTPLDMTISGALFSQAGPAGKGGLDLDQGVGTGSGDESAEIVDMGIDCSTATVFWRKQIGSANGAKLVTVDPTQLENFSFDNVDSKEAIAAAFDSGVQGSDATRDECSGGGTVTDVTDEVEVGDVFAVFANNKYYLIRVDNIQDLPGNADDKYEMSIKY